MYVHTYAIPLECSNFDLIHHLCEARSKLVVLQGETLVHKSLIKRLILVGLMTLKY